jgi:hypothetical protein
MILELMPTAALNIAGVGSGHAALMSLQSALAALDVPWRALLHFLPVVAGVFHVLFAELADHGLASSICGTLVANVMLGPGFLPLRSGGKLIGSAWASSAK